MDTTSIRLLKSLVEGPKESSLLTSLLGIKERRLAYIMKNLEDLNYAEKENTIIKLKENSKTILFRDVTKIIDVEKLLYESNEIVLSEIVETDAINDIIKKSGLSKATVYRSISDLQSIGAVIKKEDNVRIDESKESLILFAKMLRTEREEKYEGDGTEIIYKSGSQILRRVPVGKITKGATTAFALFSDYGIEYQTTYDYFCEQEMDLDIQDILMHAVYAANYEKDKMALLMSIVFYAKHKDKMDILQLRKKSTELGISKIWLDIESYIRKKQLKNPDLFLPWDEFVSKAKLYEISLDKYTLPEPSDSLFEDFNKKLKKPMTIYLFGGENMRIKKLKASTKDCDIVLEDKEIFDVMTNILTEKLGYKPIIQSEYSDEDRRIYPDDIFIHEKRSRIDLFTTTIMQDLSLSSSMKEKADIRDYGKLKVALLRNEHVFLLKAIASREGDIQDMATLVRGSLGEPQELQHGSFDWDLVWDEILRQEHINHTKDFTTTIFEQIAYLAQQTDIVAPFLDKLRRHVLDRLIKIMLRGGSVSIKEITELLIGAEITEPMVRNRIDALTKAKIIEKYPVGRATYVRLLKNSEFSETEWAITSHHLENYLSWRFYLRPIPSEKILEEVINELKEMDFKTISELDDIIRNSVDTLIQYEKEHFSKNHFDCVGALRICIGLHYPKINKDQASNFYIYDSMKFNAIAKTKLIPPSAIKMV